MFLLLLLSATCGYSVWKFGKGTRRSYQCLVAVCYSAILFSIVSFGLHGSHPELMATSTFLNLMALFSFKH